MYGWAILRRLTKATNEKKLQVPLNTWAPFNIRSAPTKKSHTSKFLMPIVTDFDFFCSWVAASVVWRRGFPNAEQRAIQQNAFNSVWNVVIPRLQSLLLNVNAKQLLYIVNPKGFHIIPLYPKSKQILKSTTVLTFLYLKALKDFLDGASTSKRNDLIPIRGCFILWQS